MKLNLDKLVVLLLLSKILINYLFFIVDQDNGINSKFLFK
jgi:hypothetical protein